MKCKRCGWEIEPIPGEEDNWYLTDQACDDSPATVGLYTCEYAYVPKDDNRHIPWTETEIVETILAKYEV